MRITGWMLTVLLVGCGNPLDVALLPVDVEGDLVVSPDEPGTFRIIAENAGGERIVWGMGSSSCQLGLEVEFDGRRHPAGGRICTADLVEQGLDAGESRTEEVEWDGAVPDIEGQPFHLPEGRYRVFGVAGDQGESRGLWVTVSR